MKIETIKLKDYRNYQTLELHPHPGVNLLFGQNGVGKTNLLEAIHFCALGRSHRTAQDKEVVARDKESGAAGVTVMKREGRHEVAVRLIPNGAQKKQIFVDRKKINRLSDLMGVVQVVIFSPEDLMLVREGPQVRRRYLDMLISQMDKLYFVSLQRYQKVLEQRNFLLKEGRRTGKPDTTMLDIYEHDMAHTAFNIIRARRSAAEQLAAIAGERYQLVSGRQKENFAIRYECCAGDEKEPEGYLEKKLREGREIDLQRGFTGIGPHREDLSLTLMGKEMKLFASQGQVRTAALAMKMSQLDFLTDRTGESPILLLDDVMSELDMNRRTRLLEEIGSLQTFVTCTDESDLEGCREKRSYRVRMDSAGYAGLRENTPGEAVAEDEEEEPDFS